MQYIIAFVPGNVGLVNLGATCYMNSLMQIQYIIEQYWSDSSNTAKKQQQIIQNRQEYKEEKDSEEYKCMENGRQ